MSADILHEVGKVSSFLHELAALMNRCLLASSPDLVSQMLREFQADILKRNCPLAKMVDSKKPQSPVTAHWVFLTDLLLYSFLTPAAVIGADLPHLASFSCFKAVSLSAIGRRQTGCDHTDGRHI